MDQKEFNKTVTFALKQLNLQVQAQEKEIKNLHAIIDELQQILKIKIDQDNLHKK